MCWAIPQNGERGLVLRDVSRRSGHHLRSRARKKGKRAAQGSHDSNGAPDSSTHGQDVVVYFFAILRRDTRHMQPCNGRPSKGEDTIEFSVMSPKGEGEVGLGLEPDQRRFHCKKPHISPGAFRGSRKAHSQTVSRYKGCHHNRQTE